MSTEPLFVIPATVLLLVASAFFVIIEFALIGARRHRLEADAEASASSRAALRGMHELTIMLAGAQLGITLCTFALGAITKPFVDRGLGSALTALGVPAQVAGGASFILSLLLVTFLHLVVGEMAPKSWAIAQPERTAKLIALPSRVFIHLVRPLLVFANAMANRLVSATGVEPVERAAVGGRDAATIRHLVEHSGSAGVLEEDVHDQLSEVLELSEHTIGELIDPRERATGVERSATVAEVQRIAASSGHKRILVWRGDGTAPDVVHVRDTLMLPETTPVSELCRPAFVLESEVPVYEALNRIRAASEQLAAVMEQGRFLGVVTASDIMHRVLPRAVQAAAR